MPENQIKILNASIKMEHDSIPEVEISTKINKIDENKRHVVFSLNFSREISLNDWKIDLQPDFHSMFHWSPHLTPTNRNVIDQHIFRSPALIGSSGNKVILIIPDLELLANTYEDPKSHHDKNKPRWYMDINAQRNLFTLGMCGTKVTEHVIYERSGSPKYSKGIHNFGFYIFYYEDLKIADNPWRIVLDFLWDRFGRVLYEKKMPLPPELSEYVETTYKWAYENWSEHVWQEFDLNGKKVGAAVLVVDISQSPNYPHQYSLREAISIWNQVWFSSLRTASGLYRYARRIKNDELIEKAKLTKELALSAPQEEGIFPAVIATKSKKIEIEGKKVYRSKGWETAFWTNSNRNPYTPLFRFAKDRIPYHILDMSWTGIQMLQWYIDLEKDERLLDYCKNYAEALMKLQYNNGYFPAWLDYRTLEIKKELNDSPESSLSVLFLLKLYNIIKDERYKESALKGIKPIIEDVIPEGRWEDFETYWSCCRVGTLDHIGKKYERNNMFKQCNFSMYWTAEALLECYYITKEEKYLKLGQRVLDELLMTQASWQPPYIYVKALGGFGVMNADAEWNDSRQALFAELIVRYGRELNIEEYVQRGLAALRASFVMMYTPKNPDSKEQYEKAWPFFGEDDYGFTMENYGHGGITSPEGEGIGSFTIYDWGNGAAAEAYNRMIDHFGEDFILTN